MGLGVIWSAMVRYLVIAVAFTVCVPASAPAYDDRVERRSRELLLPDDYLDPLWSPPPVVDPLPTIAGEDDSVLSDPLEAPVVEGQEAGMGLPVGEEMIELPFEDIVEDFGEEDFSEQDGAEEPDAGLDYWPGIPTE